MGYTSATYCWDWSCLWNGVVGFYGRRKEGPQKVGPVILQPHCSTLYCCGHILCLGGVAAGVSPDFSMRCDLFLYIYIFFLRCHSYWTPIKTELKRPLELMLWGTIRVPQSCAKRPTDLLTSCWLLHSFPLTLTSQFANCLQQPDST